MNIAPTNLNWPASASSSNPQSWGIASSSEKWATTEIKTVASGFTPTVDGSLDLVNEWYDARNITLNTSCGNATVYFKHDEEKLYVGFDMPCNESESWVNVFIDPEHDGGSTPGGLDRDLTIQYSDPNYEYSYNGSQWGSVTPSGWRQVY